MRCAVVTLLLGGCDLVVGLDAPPPIDAPAPGHDEDDDGTADVDDLCPHQAAPELLDVDGDGIGDRCDPRPDSPDLRYFFAFAGGDVGGLIASGATSSEADAITLSATTGTTSLTLDIDAAIVDLESGIEVLDHGDVSQSGYAEVGFFAAHRVFSPDQLMRGDNCFLGYTKAVAPGTPMYLEFNNDAVSLTSLDARFDTELRGKQGPMKFSRTPNDIGCTFTANAASYASRGAHAVVPRTITGKVAVTVTNVRVRLDYLWIVTPRP